MSVSSPFIHRPIATSLLGVAVFLGGMLGYLWLPVSSLPQVDFPTIQVTTQLPGASPDVMASLVTAPLERNFGQIPSLQLMTSSSSFGISQTTLQFELSRDIDAAAQDVQAAINASASVLPRNLPYPPVYSKVNPADSPIITLAIRSDTISLRALSDIADTLLAQRLSELTGVGRVTVQGNIRPAIRIRADLSRLANYGIALEDLRNVIVAANVAGPKGALDGVHQSYTISANDQLTAADAYRNVIITYRNGAPVLLRDVAEIIDDLENSRVGGWYQGKPAIVVDVQRQPGANVIETVQRIKNELPKLQRSMPVGATLTVVHDATESIRASVRDVQFTLILSVALVITVVLIFLRTIRATVIAGVALPLSLIATFGVMWFCGFSLDNLSLMALTIGTGFVVDDAIVMIENIDRFLESGDSPLDAALKGAGQIGFTIVSLTVSLIAVLIPLLFMGDIVGRLFREFAVTLAVTILVSAGVSLSLTPMMSAKLLKHRKEGQRGRFYEVTEDYYNRIIAFYGRTVKWVLKHQTATLLVTAATLVLTLFLYVIVPKGFFPVQDTGVILGVSEAPDFISFDAMSERQQALAKVILQDKDVESLSSFIGVDGTNVTPNSGRIQINLKPRDERSDDASAIIRRLQPAVQKVEGITLYMQPVQDLTVEDRVSRTQFQYSIEDADANELAQWTPKLVAKLQSLPQLRDVATDQLNNGLRTNITIDRDTASRLGIFPQAIDNTLYDAYGQRQVSTIFTQLNQYHVVLEVLPNFAQTPDNLGDIYIRPSVVTANSGAPTANGASVTTSGNPVPISTFTRMNSTSTALAVNHQGQFPVVTLSFNLAPGASLGDATKAIQQAEAEIQLPASIHASFQGTAAAFQNSLATEPFLILAAVITVYIVLGVLYESYIHPITILSTLPSAGVGAILALMITGNDLTVVALIGIILLIGIVKKNAIMMIDFALEAERVEHKPPEEAIYQACLLRFRPIMMTTMAALLGGLPLALGTGTGAELRRPLGITIVGGLLLSQLLTLYTTPVVYLWFDRLAQRFSKYRIGNEIPPEPMSAD